jgi:hypothetical protein
MRAESLWWPRLRWRLRGAWQWPTFVGVTALDTAVIALLPFYGDGTDALGALLLAVFANLVAVALVAPLAGLAVVRARRDLPRIVARDYAGTIVIAFVSTCLLLVGLLHRPTIVANRNAMNDAITRAQAWIGDHAPAEFRRNLTSVSVFAIEPGRMYRMCVPSHSSGRTYCVVVKTKMPFAQSVTFAGYESNADFSRGAW